MSFTRPQSANYSSAGALRSGVGRASSRPGSPTNASRRAPSAGKHNRKSGLSPAADLAATLLAPKPGHDMPNRVLVHGRRPNTAGLRQHTRPWSFDTLQTIVTRNGIGCATWQCTMRELSSFQRGQRRRMGPTGDDISEGEEDETPADDPLKKEVSQHSLAAAGGSTTPAAGGVAGEPPAMSRLAAAGRYAITEVPRDAVLLKMLRSLSALEAAMTHAATSTSPTGFGDNVVGGRSSNKSSVMDRIARDLRALIVDRPEIHRGDTRAPGVSVKVVHRHTLIDVCRQVGSWDRDGINTLVDCFQAFSGGESVVMVHAMSLALDHIQQKSALSLLHIVFHTLKSLKATAHRAELYAAERAVVSVAAEAQRLETKAMEEQKTSSTSPSSPTTSPYRRKSFSLPTSSSRRLKGLSSANGMEAATEFSDLVAVSLYPRRRGAASGGGGDAMDAPASGSSSPTAAAAAMVAVDAVTWKELRNSIVNAVSSDGETSKYARLSSLVMQHSL